MYRQNNEICTITRDKWQDSTTRWLEESLWIWLGKSARRNREIYQGDWSCNFFSILRGFCEQYWQDPPPPSPTNQVCFHAQQARIWNRYYQELTFRKQFRLTLSHVKSRFVCFLTVTAFDSVLIFSHINKTNWYQRTLLLVAPERIWQQIYMDKDGPYGS